MFMTAALTSVVKPQQRSGQAAGNDPADIMMTGLLRLFHGAVLNALLAGRASLCRIGAISVRGSGNARKCRHDRAFRFFQIVIQHLCGGLGITILQQRQDVTIALDIGAMQLFGVFQQAKCKP